MNAEKIKEFALRMEGMADGFKQGCLQTLKWLTEEIEKEKNGIEKD